MNSLPIARIIFRMQDEPRSKTFLASTEIYLNFCNKYSLSPNINLLHMESFNQMVNCSEKKVSLFF